MLFRALLFLLFLSQVTLEAATDAAAGDSSLPIVSSDATVIRLGISSDSSPGQQQKIVVPGDTAERRTIIASMPSIDSPMSSTTRLVGGTAGSTLGLSSPEDSIKSKSKGSSSGGGALDSSSVREEEGVDDDRDDVNDVTDVEPIVIVLFMFFGLGIGIIIMQLLSVIGRWG